MLFAHFVNFVNKEESILFSNLPKEHLIDIDKCKSPLEYTKGLRTKKNKKQGKINLSNGYVYLCSSDEKISNTEFKKTSKMYTMFFDMLYKNKQGLIAIEDEENKQFRHNITSFTAHLSQEIYKLIPQEILIQRGYEKQLDAIQKIILDDVKATSNMLLSLLKDLKAIKTEIDAYEMLTAKEPNLSIQAHSIHKVLHFSLAHFMKLLKEKEINIKITNCESTVMIDYKSVSVVFNNIFSNIQKYILPNSELNINFKGSNGILELEIDMKSVKVEEDEIEKIFHPKYSGKWAKKSKLDGTGMGLYVASELMKLNDSMIEFYPIDSTVEMFDEIPYMRNTIILKFPMGVISV